MRNKKIAKDVLWAENALTNLSIQPEIRDRFGLFGFTQEKIDEANALVLVANTSILNQENEQGHRQKAYEDYGDAKDEIDRSYKQKIALGSILFKKDQSAYISLGLIGTREETVTGWFAQVGSFYTNVLTTPLYLEKYATMGVSLETFQGEQVKYLNTKALYQNWTKERGEAENATEERDAAIAKLREWSHDFKVLARVVLADTPQLLETLGIKSDS